MSELSKEELSQVSQTIDGQVEIATQSGDEVALAKAKADKKAVEIQSKRNAGQKIKRPKEIDQTEAAKTEIDRLQKEIDDIQTNAQKKAQKQTEDIRAGVFGRLDLPEGLEFQSGDIVSPRLTLEETAKIAENQEKISRLQSKLAKADDVAVQQQGQQTAQQIDDARDVASMQTDNLGALGEFREGADELEAQPTELGELDPDAMEAENQTMLDALQD